MAANPATIAITDVSQAIAWVAHGVRIVQSAYPARKFNATDKVEAGKPHGELIGGPRGRGTPSHHKTRSASFRNKGKH